MMREEGKVTRASLGGRNLRADVLSLQMLLLPSRLTFIGEEAGQ